MTEITPLDQFRFCREEVQHEYNVLGNRLTSYITSQSFLFTTYGVSMSNQSTTWGVTFRLVFPLTVCTVGILTSLRAQPGIQSACDILDALHKRQYKLYEDPSVQALDPTDAKWIISVHQHSLKFSALAAYIFGSSWLALLGLAFFVFYRSI